MAHVKLEAHRGHRGHCPDGPVRLAEFIKNFLVKFKIESESLFRSTPQRERERERRHRDHKS